MFDSETLIPAQGAGRQELPSGHVLCYAQPEFCNFFVEHPCRVPGLLRHIAAVESVFVVRANEKLTAFVELESATRGSPSFTHPCTVERHSAGTEHTTKVS
jgi:hypothetical protein